MLKINKNKIETLLDNSKLVFPEVEGKLVYVGLSGGVDSSVAAAVLLANGANVKGVFMKNWTGEKGLQDDCPWEEDQNSAENAALALDIDFQSYNFEKEYKEFVVNYFFNEYEAGRTPNPDILCNSEIKFKAFWEKASNEGIELMATGHYARLAPFAGASELQTLTGYSSSDKILARAKDTNKDQTYFLSGLNQEQLNRAVFPLGGLEKKEVREIAAHLGLPNAKRKDSQGICFIGDIDVRLYLRKYIERKPGVIVDIDTSKSLGEHDGIAFYTIGQREGLKIGGSNMPYYVVAKDKTTNQLFVAKGRENSHLLKDSVPFVDFSFVNKKANLAGNIEDLNSNSKLNAQVRYRQKPVDATIALKDLENNTDNNLFGRKGGVHFKEKIWAPAEGQTLSVSIGEYLLAKATIN